jgi:ribosomal protein S12 methylthiotransferase
VENKIKNQRVKQLYAVQKAISKDNLSAYKGKTIEVICDGIDYDRQCFVGRTYFQAPEIDGKVYFTAGNDEVINQGEKYQVKITRNNSYDLFGRIV